MVSSSSVCLCMRLHVYLFVCMPDSEADMSVCHACLSAYVCLSVCQSVCVCLCLPACLSVHNYSQQLVVGLL